MKGLTAGDQNPQGFWLPYMVWGLHLSLGFLCVLGVFARAIKW